MQIQTKLNAQQRADQIDAFRAELAILEDEQILLVDTNQRSALTRYHNQLLGQLAATFDIDATSREKQLSLGMRITSFLGALALGASVFFFFYQFWGRFSTTTQVVMLVSAPLLWLVATMVAAHKEKSGYFAKLCGLVCLTCFVLDLSMLGQIFNVRPTANAFLVWAVFAFLLAYATDARLLLAAGILSFAAFLSAQMGTWSGCYWIYFGERPENFFPAALVLFFIPAIPHGRFTDFASIYRVFAMLLLFIPVLILANWGRVSYLDLPSQTIEVIYQLAGFAISAAAIWLGVTKSWPEVINTGITFFALFLYTKFYDWWWDWLPKYLFFLVIGLSAILILLLFKRIRNATTGPQGSLP